MDLYTRCSRCHQFRELDSDQSRPPAGWAERKVDAAWSRLGSRPDTVVLCRPCKEVVDDAMARAWRDVLEPPYSSASDVLEAAPEPPASPPALAPDDMPF